MAVVAVIMAGGRGERFWPLSRKSLPKQFIKLAGNKTLLQDTIDRIRPVVGAGDILVVTGREFVGLVQEQTGLPRPSILAEPEGRDTAPCIGLAAVVIQERFPAVDPVMVVLPADHVVRDKDAFGRGLRQAVELAASRRALVTIGIPPSRPETGYGYIKCGSPVAEDVYVVEQFIEKPNAAAARDLLQAGNYLWNSGIFIWRVSVILAAMARHLPELAAGLEVIRQGGREGRWEETLQHVFPQLPRISIDYGVMEKDTGVYVVRGDFGWDDVGVWSALPRVCSPDARGNVVATAGGDGPAGLMPVLFDCQGCIVYPAQGRLVAALGVADLIIVDTPDTLLVCRKGEEDRLKELLGFLRENGYEEYV